jgi:hypothetical protein
LEIFIRQRFGILAMEGSKEVLKVFVRETTDIGAHACLQASLSTVITNVTSRHRISFKIMGVCGGR